MRLMVTAKFPHEKFNEAVKDGSAGEKIDAILNDMKPEAVYFTENGGRRSAVMIVELENASEIPMIAEPWFLTFNADVELKIVMSTDDLRNAGLDKLGHKWG